MEDTGGMDDDLYLRVSAMDVPSSRGRKGTAVFVSIAAVASILALSIIVFVVVRMYRKRQRSRTFLQAASEGGNLVA